MKLYDVTVPILTVLLVISCFGWLRSACFDNHPVAFYDFVIEDGKVTKTQILYVDQKTGEHATVERNH